MKRVTGKTKDWIGKEKEQGREEGPEAGSHGEVTEGLSFGWKDVLALSIAFLQVFFLRAVIGIASFAAVIWLLGKFWLRSW